METYEVEDRLHIADLVARYSNSVTLRDWDGLAACFHPDATWRTSNALGLHHTGVSEIREKISASVSALTFLVQMTHNLVLELRGDGVAEVTVVISEIGQDRQTGRGLNMVGVFTDRITKDDRGLWKFQDRYFVPHYLDPGVLPGAVLVQHPTP